MVSCVTSNLLRALAAVVVICGSNVAACAGNAGNDRSEGQAVSHHTIEDALRAHSNELMSLPGVVGVSQGLCAGQPCIKVFVNQRTEALEQAIHRILAGYPVAIEQSGPVRARPDESAPR